MLHEYQGVAPFFDGAPGLYATVCALLCVKTLLIAFSVHAGIGLWRLRPGAVESARFVLVLGLATGMLVLLLKMSWRGAPLPELSATRELTAHFIPTLIFVIASFAYLNRSLRVRLTYATAAAPPPT